jgi:hypothetical protein
MPILFDHDPETGVSEYFDYDPIRDQVHMTYSQDVSSFLDHMNSLRKDPTISQNGMDEDWWHYCSIPPVVEIELRTKGLILGKREHMPAIIREINVNYPYLKATAKHHAEKVR